MKFITRQPFTARYIGDEVQIPVGHVESDEYISLRRSDFDRLFIAYIEPAPETAFERAKRLQGEAIAAAQEALADGIRRSEEFQTALKKYLKGE